MVDKPKNTFQPTYDLANHFTYYLWKLMLIFIILTVLSCAVWTGFMHDFQNTQISKMTQNGKIIAFCDIIHNCKIDWIAKITQIYPIFNKFVPSPYLSHEVRSDWLTKNNKPENPFQNFDVTKKLLTRKKK